MTKLEKYITKAQRENVIQTIELAAKPMLANFNKYWHPLQTFASLAIVFDPRYKLNFLYFYFSNKLELSQEACEFQVAHIRELLYNYFSGYAPKHEKLNPLEKAVDTATSQNPLDDDHDNDRFHAFLASAKGTSHILSVKAKLDLYLRQPTVIVPKGNHFKILDWWKANQAKLPLLSKLARTVLMAPMTSVASESAFSTGGRILDEFRSQLSIPIVEAFICAQDWLRYPTNICNNHIDDLEVL